jgi:glycosyltransferase involved in cell wall biosynthesis
MLAHERITLLAPAPLDAKTGGYEYDRQLVAALTRRGVDVSLAALDPSYPVPTPAARRQTARVLASLPDGATVVVDGLAFGAMPEEAAHEANRLRIVALVHHPLAEETGLDAVTAEGLRDSEARALQSARLTVVTSRATAARMPAYGVAADTVIVVEPGTVVAPLAPGSRARGTAPFELLVVATLIPRKGHDVLLQALARLKALPWRLTCVGSLELHPDTATRVRQLVTGLGLHDRVAFTGALEPADVARHYHAADVLVMPTHHEGFGMAVAEALARGLPVVGTPTGAIPELVGTEAGLLVPAGDAGALADALQRVMTDSGLFDRLRAGARAARLRLPTWDDAAATFLNALTRLSSHAHGSV